MTTRNAPHIKAVTATKDGRFWAVKTDGKLLAIVLYKAGAFAVRELIRRLAGLSVDEPEAEKTATKSEKTKAADKKPQSEKGKAAIKAKPPKKAAERPPEAAPEPATATSNS